MRILQLGTVTSLGGGVCSYIKSIISLEKKQIQFFIGLASNKDKVNGAKTVEFDMRYKLVEILKKTSYLKSILKKNKIDLVHVHTQRAALICALYKLMTRNSLPVIYTPHGFRHSQLHGVKYVIHILIEWFIISMIDKVVVITDLEIKQMKLFNSKIIKIRSVIQIPKDYKSINLRKKLDVSSDVKIITMIGSVYDIKQPDLFIKIAEQFSSDVLFLWLGDGPELDSCRNYIEKKLIDNVVFFGRVEKENIFEILDQIDIFLLTSKLETFPLSILEAYSKGKAVVCNNYEGVDEIVINNVNGLLFDYNNYQDGENKIKHLLDDSSLLNSLGANAKRFVRPYVDLNRFHEEYTNVFNIFPRPNKH